MGGLMADWPAGQSRGPTTSTFGRPSSSSRGASKQRRAASCTGGSSPAVGRGGGGVDPLSSAASSSGCSSVECSSIESPPSSARRPTSSTSMAAAREADDCLEVNEFLYLGWPLGTAIAAAQLAPGKRLNVSALDCTATGAAGELPTADKPMSEFSAVTLRRSLKQRLNTMNNASAASKQAQGRRVGARKDVAGLRRSSTMKLNQPSSSGAVATQRRRESTTAAGASVAFVCQCDQCCSRQLDYNYNNYYCCCCSGECAQQLTAPAQATAVALEALHCDQDTVWTTLTTTTTATATMDTSARPERQTVANKGATKTAAPLSRKSVTARAPSTEATTPIAAAGQGQLPATVAPPPLRGSATATATTTTATLTLQRPKARRPLPVPPPVVPLYRELALLGSGVGAERQASRSSPSEAPEIEEAKKAEEQKKGGPQSSNYSSQCMTDSWQRPPRCCEQRPTLQRAAAKSLVNISSSSPTATAAAAVASQSAPGADCDTLAPKAATEGAASANEKANEDAMAGVWATIGRRREEHKPNCDTWKDLHASGDAACSKTAAAAAAAVAAAATITTTTTTTNTPTMTTQQRSPLAHLERESAQSCLHISSNTLLAASRGSASASGSSKFNGRGGSVHHEDLADTTNELDSSGAGSATGGGVNFSATLGRTTGKILERLKQGLMASFSAAPPPPAQPATVTEHPSPVGAGCGPPSHTERQAPQSSQAAAGGQPSLSRRLARGNLAARGRLAGCSGPVGDGGDNEPAPIYDTPEYDGQALRDRPLAASCLRRPASRPTMPPPPPPPLPSSLLGASGGGKRRHSGATRPPRARPESACVEAGRGVTGNSKANCASRQPTNGDDADEAADVDVSFEFINDEPLSAADIDDKRAAAADDSLQATGNRNAASTRQAATTKTTTVTTKKTTTTRTLSERSASEAGSRATQDRNQDNNNTFTQCRTSTTKPPPPPTTTAVQQQQQQQQQEQPKATKSQEEKEQRRQQEQQQQQQQQHKRKQQKAVKWAAGTGEAGRGRAVIGQATLCSDNDGGSSCHQRATQNSSSSGLGRQLVVQLATTSEPSPPTTTTTEKNQLTSESRQACEGGSRDDRTSVKQPTAAPGDSNIGTSATQQAGGGKKKGILLVSRQPAIGQPVANSASSGWSSFQQQQQQRRDKTTTTAGPAALAIESRRRIVATKMGSSHSSAGQAADAAPGTLAAAIDKQSPSATTTTKTTAQPQHQQQQQQQNNRTGPIKSLSIMTTKQQTSGKKGGKSNGERGEAKVGRQKSAAPSFNAERVTLATAAAAAAARADEDSFVETRRRSIQNGDVFIYPSLYKDLNECQKCSRDNRICNCNDIDYDDDDDADAEIVELSSPAPAPDSAAASSSSSCCSSASSSSSSSSESSSLRSAAALATTRDSFESRGLATSGSEEEPLHGRRMDKSGNKSNQCASQTKRTGALLQARTQQQQQQQQQQHPLKTVYKISISNGLIDSQKSQQLRLSTTTTTTTRRRQTTRLSPIRSPAHSCVGPQDTTSATQPRAPLSDGSSGVAMSAFPAPVDNGRQHHEAPLETTRPVSSSLSASSSSSSPSSNDGGGGGGGCKTTQAAVAPSVAVGSSNSGGSAARGCASRRVSERTTTAAAAINASEKRRPAAPEAGGGCGYRTSNLVPLSSSPPTIDCEYGYTSSNKDAPTTTTTKRAATGEQLQQQGVNMLTTTSLTGNPSLGQLSGVVAAQFQSQSHHQVASDINNNSYNNDNAYKTISTSTSTCLPVTCDTRAAAATENEATAASVVKKSDSGEQQQQQQQLVRNLNVGDPIKITRTTISIGPAAAAATAALVVGAPHQSSPSSSSLLAATNDDGDDTSHTSIVPIQTQSLRRRRDHHQPLTKLNRQAIHEDDDDDDDCDDLAGTTTTTTTRGNHHHHHHHYHHKHHHHHRGHQQQQHQQQQICYLPEPIDIVPKPPIQLEDPLRPRGERRLAAAASENGGDVLEYSPILTSVRDYIKNINTTDLKVQTTSATSTVTGHCTAVTLPQLTCGDGALSADLIAAPAVAGDLLVGPRDRPLASVALVSVVAANGDVVQQQQMGSDGGSGGAGGASSTSEHLFANGTFAATLISTSTTTSNSTTATNFDPLANCRGPLLAQKVAGTESANHTDHHQLDSHHLSGVVLAEPMAAPKSIFDGASKDDILEYLEDARERVPEILMAADDVMVINENELIVVNQLEPDSPATPISIVEATEEVMTLDATAMASRLTTSSPATQLTAGLIQAGESRNSGGAAELGGGHLVADILERPPMMLQSPSPTGDPRANLVQVAAAADNDGDITTTSSAAVANNPEKFRQHLQHIYQLAAAQQQHEGAQLQQLAAATSASLDAAYNTDRGDDDTGIGSEMNSGPSSKLDSIDLVSSGGEHYSSSSNTGAGRPRAFSSLAASTLDSMELDGQATTGALMGSESLEAVVELTAAAAGTIESTAGSDGQSLSTTAASNSNNNKTTTIRGSLSKDLRASSSNSFHQQHHRFKHQHQQYGDRRHRLRRSIQTTISSMSSSNAAKVSDQLATNSATGGSADQLAVMAASIPRSISVYTTGRRNSATDAATTTTTTAAATTDNSSTGAREPATSTSIISGPSTTGSKGRHQLADQQRRALEMLLLQQRFSVDRANRDSLSSPSSSPPSSTSPASTASSSGNQTSGNCSAASTFYASSSLSCSSPLLAPSSVASNGSPASFGSARPSGVWPSCAPATTTATTSLAALATEGTSSTRSVSPSVEPSSGGAGGALLAPMSPAVTYGEQILEGLIKEGRSANKPDLESSLEHSLASAVLAEPTGRSFFELAEAAADSSSSKDSTTASEVHAESQQSSNASTRTVQEEPIDFSLLQAVRSAAAAAEAGQDAGNIDLSVTALGKLSVIDEAEKQQQQAAASGCGDTKQLVSATGAQLESLVAATSGTAAAAAATAAIVNSSDQKAAGKVAIGSQHSQPATAPSLVIRPRHSAPTFSSSANLMYRTAVHGPYATMSRLNNYFMNRHPLENTPDMTVEFQCLDCDQFIDVDQATMLNKTNELRLLSADSGAASSASSSYSLTPDQLDRAYIAAMNGLPLCKGCEKKRTERKEIISEFVETELKYGRDLKIIHDEFYRPMQIAGLLSKDQIQGVFLNLEELTLTHSRFAERLERAIVEANSMGDTDYNTVHIGRIFVDSAEMLHTFESYCIRQGAAACLLARLAKEKELLRIFLRVSQMENTLLRRMNLAAFLMVPVQRVTKYPLLLNRLYKVTAYYHKDREALRDAQLKVELHLEHINQQTKGAGSTNKIWRRISNLSAPSISSRQRCLINAEDIGYIKLRKTAMDMLKWDRAETQFIHSGKLNFAPLNEFLIKQKMRPIRYMAAHALLIVLGKPSEKYRPDLVKPNLDSKLMTPTPGGNGIRETALLLFREKNSRFVPCREPLFLSNCVLSNDCSQFNSECPPLSQSSSSSSSSAAAAAAAAAANYHSTATNPKQQQQTGAASASGLSNQQQQQSIQSAANSVAGRQRKPSASNSDGTNEMSLSLARPPTAADDGTVATSRGGPGRLEATATNGGDSSRADTRSLSGSALSMSSLKSLQEVDQSLGMFSTSSPPPLPPTHTSRSYSLASALPRNSATTSTTCTTSTSSSSVNLAKSAGGGGGSNIAAAAASSNLTIINQLMTKVNNYHKQATGASSRASIQAAAALSAGPVEGHHHHQQQQQQQHQPSSSSSSSKAGLGSTASSPAVASSSSSSYDHQQQQQQHSAQMIMMTMMPVTTTASAALTTLQQTAATIPLAGLADHQAAAIKQLSAGGGQSGQQQQHATSATNEPIAHQHYNHHYFHNHQPYGDFEESFEIHERLTKESMLLRADTPLKTRYWLQMLRYHAKDLGQWRTRRNALANIMMMRQD